MGIIALDSCHILLAAQIFRLDANRTSRDHRLSELAHGRTSNCQFSRLNILAYDTRALIHTTRPY